jgi:AmmeMemoRadiSam system protein B/AmmeMemoRadiSam system protein A
MMSGHARSSAGLLCALAAITAGCSKGDLQADKSGTTEIQQERPQDVDRPEAEGPLVERAAETPRALPLVNGPLRPPAVAGAFYPASADVLRRDVAAYVAAAEKVALPGDVIAVITPHAGYAYCGPVAGAAFAQIEGLQPDVVVVIGGHSSQLPYGAVYSRGGFHTPLGDLPVDVACARDMLAASEALVADDTPHVEGGFAFKWPDHALECIVPFLQVVVPHAPFVPVYFNRTEVQLAGDVGRGIAAGVGRRRALVVCSTDLSHYPDAQTARQADHEMLDAIVTLDIDTILTEDRRLRTRYAARGLDCTVCGLGGVLATVVAARELGATGATLVRYQHSGDIPEGRPDRVVGYGAVVIYGKPAAAASERGGTQAMAHVDERMLNDEERVALIALARRSVETGLERQDVPAPQPLTDAMQTPCAAFVTLHKHGRLRGCIGTFDRSQPLWRVVAEFARTAAFGDRRFDPVTRDELPTLTFEISVLSPLRKLDDPLSLRLGTDGVWIVGVNGRTGTYLPQVATQTGWSKEQFLSSCAGDKARLAPDAWKDPNRATVYAYTAEVFGEH